MKKNTTSSSSVENEEKKIWIPFPLTFNDNENAQLLTKSQWMIVVLVWIQCTTPLKSSASRSGTS